MEVFPVGKQIQKRLSRGFIEGLLEAFNDHRIRKEKTCDDDSSEKGAALKAQGRSG